MNYLHIIKHESDGYEVRVFLNQFGYTVGIYDTDADEMVPVLKSFPTLDAAIAYAETC